MAAENGNAQVILVVVQSGDEFSDAAFPQLIGHVGLQTDTGNSILMASHSLAYSHGIANVFNTYGFDVHWYSLVEGEKVSLLIMPDSITIGNGCRRGFYLCGAGFTMKSAAAKDFVFSL